MQQLLTGRTRLPQFAYRPDGSRKEYKRSEIGKLPEDWEVVTLGGIAKIIMGQSPSSNNYNNKGIGLPLVQGNADISKRRTIIRNYTSQITKTAKQDDLILSVRAPVGEVARATFECCIGRGVSAVRYENEYLYHWLVSFESEWEEFSKGSTFDSINSDELRAIQLSLPAEQEQTAIATILSDMDEEIQTLEQRLKKTSQIKQGMMQELLTGKTRLVKPQVRE
jgi:type I restriction enzyme S subunit